MADSKSRHRLYEVIDLWVESEQTSDDALDMWVSDDLVEHMTKAAWAVLDESRATQQWLKREGHMPELAESDQRPPE